MVLMRLRHEIGRATSPEGWTGLDRPGPGGLGVRASPRGCSVSSRHGRGFLQSGHRGRAVTRVWPGLEVTRCPGVTQSITQSGSGRTKMCVPGRDPWVPGGCRPQAQRRNQVENQAEEGTRQDLRPHSTRGAPTGRQHPFPGTPDPMSLTAALTPRAFTHATDPTSLNLHPDPMSLTAPLNPMSLYPHP